jgi:hypothetical protein
MFLSRRACQSGCGFILALGIGLLSQGRADAQVPRTILIPGFNGIQQWTVGFRGGPGLNVPPMIGGAPNTLQNIIPAGFLPRRGGALPAGLAGGGAAFGTFGSIGTGGGSSSAFFRSVLSAGPGSVFIASASNNPRVLIGNAGGPFTLRTTVGASSKSGGLNGMSGGAY